MRNKPYKRKPGDFEVRILRDGRVIMLVPDENLLEAAKAIEAKPNAAECVSGDNQKCQNLNQ
jgi:hypothetical protein